LDDDIGAHWAKRLIERKEKDGATAQEELDEEHESAPAPQTGMTLTKVILIAASVFAVFRFFHW
jgi:hypothetical protein